MAFSVSRVSSSFSKEISTLGSELSSVVESIAIFEQEVASMVVSGEYASLGKRKMQGSAHWA